MNNLSIFEFDQTEVRVVVDEKNTLWFHASDCAKALGYLNAPQALQDNVLPKYIQQIDLGLPGKKPNFISEPGLYQLVMRSNLPSAERFQDWVFEEVLPAIRETGKYEIGRPTNLENTLTSLDLFIADAQHIFDLAGISAETRTRRMLNAIAKYRPDLQVVVDEALQEVSGSSISTIDVDPRLPVTELPKTAIKINNDLNFRELPPFESHQQRMVAKMRIFEAFEDFLKASSDMKKMDAQHAFADKYNIRQIPLDGWVYQAVPGLCRGTLSSIEKDIKAEEFFNLGGNFGNRKGCFKITSASAIQDFIIQALKDEPEIACDRLYEQLKIRFGEVNLHFCSRTLERWVKWWKGTRQK